MKALIFAIVILLLAGCLKDGEKSNPGEPARNLENKETDIEPGIEENNSALSEAISFKDYIQGDECIGFSGAHYYPPTTSPAPAPEGWQRNDDAPLTAIALMVWQCGHVGLNGLERPASLLWEYSSSAHPPLACFEDAPGHLFHVLNVFSDDPALVEVLRDQYGAPAQLATFGVTQEEASTTWTWMVQNETSSFQVFQERYNGEIDDKNPFRFIWNNMNGTTWMDLRYRVRDTISSSRAGVADLQEPHYLESIPGTNAFAGSAGSWIDASFEGKFSLHGPLCA